MAIEVYISSVLLTSASGKVVESGVTITRTLNQRDTASFRVSSPDNSWSPSAGANVSIFNVGVGIVFGGLIHSVTRTRIAGTTRRVHNVTCVGYEWLADRRHTGTLVYTNQFANDIARDLVSTVLVSDGIIISDVPAGGGPLISRLEFDKSTVSDALTKLGELAARKWAIDPEKRLKFIDPSTGGTSYTLNDSSDNYLANSLEMSETLEQYANRVIVRLATVRTPLQRETYDPAHPTQPVDGSRQVWEVAYPLAEEPVIEIGATYPTVGRLSIDTGKDWYWNEGSSTITQDPGAAALTAETLIINYVGTESATFTLDNSAEISARATLESTAGIHERFIENTTPVSSYDAEAFAAAILAAFDDEALVFNFETDDMPGALPGSRITFAITGYPSVTGIASSVQHFEAAHGVFRRRIEVAAGPILKDGFETFAELQRGEGDLTITSITSGGSDDPNIQIAYPDI